MTGIILVIPLSTTTSTAIDSQLSLGLQTSLSPRYSTHHRGGIQYFHCELRIVIDDYVCELRFVIAIAIVVAICDYDCSLRYDSYVIAIDIIGAVKTMLL
jgi:hypothetical protein